MNDTLIKNHKEVVGASDLYIHLGDVAFASPEEVDEIYSGLTGKRAHRILIRGNHDSDKVVEVLNKHFVIVTEYAQIKVDNNRVVLSHFPLASWEKQFYGSTHLHGHCHGTLDNSGCLRYDMGVDSHGMRPVNLRAFLDGTVKSDREKLEANKFNSSFTKLNAG